MIRFDFAKWISAGLVTALMISSFAIAAKENSSVTVVNAKASDDAEETTHYEIGICISSTDEYYRHITEGFTDAVYDTLGKENVTVTVKEITEKQSGESIINQYITKQQDLIFANGKAALSAASIATTEIPIVSAGVIDFKTTLHIIDSGWKRYTGRNITGISGSPSVSNQLSLLIEATPDLNAVGILYSPEDTDSIYQNEILEKYLNQAGIPWKEYEIPSTATALSAYEEIADSYGSVITPGEKTFASAKEGTWLPPESLGKNGVITEILSPNSARSAKVSKFWVEEEADEAAEEDTESAEDTGGSTDTEEVSDTDDNEESSVTEDNAENTEDTEGEDNAALAESIVLTACEECDALYIAAGSTLSDQIETITSIAHENKVVTLGGDMNSGKYTLVTLYNDPYDMGYRAGKLVKKILVDEKDPGEIKIGLPSSKTTKLYQDTVAEMFGQVFPKSFSEYDEFLSEYEVGSETNRVSSEE